MGTPGLGFKVRVTVQQADQTACIQENIFVPERDERDPVIAASTLIFNGAGDIVGPGTLYTSCGDASDSPAGYRDITMQVNLTGLEPGSTLLCQESPGGADWYPCHIVTFDNKAPSGVYWSSYGSKTSGTLHLTYAGLTADKKYNGLRIKAVDTSGRSSNVVTTPTFLIDKTRPSINVAKAPGETDVGPPGDGFGGRGRVDNSATVNWGTPTWGVAEIQCNSSDVTVRGTLVDVLRDNLGGCTAVDENNAALSSQGGGTYCEAIRKSPLAHGTHSVTMTPQDVCGAGTSGTYTWDTELDFNDAVVLAPQVFSPGNKISTPTGDRYYPRTIDLSLIVPRAPRHLIYQCDCQNTAPFADVGGAASVTCGTSYDLAPYGCQLDLQGNNGDNFFAEIRDICGRKGEVRSRYSVRVPAGHICGANPPMVGMECNGSLTCCTTDSPNCCEGVCYDANAINPNPRCTGTLTVGSPPGAPTVCPDAGLFDCNYFSQCEGSTPAMSCGAGLKEGDTCNARGRCLGGLCNGKPPRSGYCTGGSASDGNNCRYDSVCGPVAGSCTTKGAGPISNNGDTAPHCFNRWPETDSCNRRDPAAQTINTPPSCGSGSGGTPPGAPCNPAESSRCLGVRYTDNNGKSCVGTGNCSNCDSTGSPPRFQTKALCDNSLSDPTKQWCARGPTGSCFISFECSGIDNWHDQSACNSACSAKGKNCVANGADCFKCESGCTNQCGFGTEEECLQYRPYCWLDTQTGCYQGEFCAPINSAFPKLSKGVANCDPVEWELACSYAAGECKGGFSQIIDITFKGTNYQCCYCTKQGGGGGKKQCLDLTY